MAQCPNCGTSTVDVINYDYCPKCGCYLPHKPKEVGFAMRVVSAIFTTIGFLIFGVIGSCFAGAAGSAFGVVGGWAGVCGSLLLIGYLWIEALKKIFRKSDDSAA